MTRQRVFGIAAILLALAAWVGAAVITFGTFASQAQWQAPGSQAVNLTQGKWTIVQKLPADSTAFTPSDVAAARTVNVEQVKVTDSSGANVPLTCVYCSGQSRSALPIDLQMANGVADFTAATTGSYTITITDAVGQMAVANPLTKLEDVAASVMGLGALGGVLIAVGIVLVVRGRGAGSAGVGGGRPAMDPGAVQPGWYQNPYLPGTDSQMWWDGKQWTSNWR